MPKESTKFISGYLIPSLDQERFGSRLMWLDKDNKIFQIDWCHKATHKWTEREAAVFIEWDKTKGRYQPQGKSYYTQSKQRFRALLYKFTGEGRIVKLKSEDKLKKVYQFVNAGKKRKSLSSSEDDNSEGMTEDDISELMKMDIYKRKISSGIGCSLEDHDYIRPVDCVVDYKSDKENDMDFIQDAPKQVSLAEKSSSDLFMCNLQSNVYQKPNTFHPIALPENKAIEEIKRDLQLAHVNNNTSANVEADEDGFLQMDCFLPPANSTDVKEFWDFMNSESSNLSDFDCITEKEGFNDVESIKGC